MLHPKRAKHTWNGYELRISAIASILLIAVVVATAS
jgi:hypothetical protein